MRGGDTEIVWWRRQVLGRAVHLGFTMRPLTGTGFSTDTNTTDTVP